jgi:hypothetical protein
MKRLIAVLTIGLSVAGAGRARAQETTPGPGRLEVTLVPGGGTFFTSSASEPAFGSYNLGAALTYNVNRIVGFEGDVGGSLGISQDLQFAGFTANQKGPNQLIYSGNVVISAPTRSSLVPYAAGGIGGLTNLQQVNLGITSNETFLTGDVGGGIKWYAANGRWGLRGDYRFFAVRSNTDAAAFFGQDTRYGHRVYGAFVINAVR